MSKDVGAALRRREDPRFVQGRSAYVANPRLPGRVYLAIQRSP